MKINYISNWIFGLIIFTVIISCEDVVQIETEPANALVVVDGWITTQSVDQTIRLNLSQPYFNATLPPPITSATVIVNSSNGSLFEFMEVEPGIYTWSAGMDSLGPMGTTFDLTINWNGMILTSFATANRVPAIDSIGQKFEEESIRGPAGVRTNFYARDPQGFGDTYWIKTFKNGGYLDKPDELNIAYDAGFDPGAQVDGLIYISPIREATNPMADDDDDESPPWILGDVIKVEIHSISNEAFSFLETTRDQITNGSNGLFSIPLSNTKGNIVDQSGQEEILGIFNVAVVSEIVDTIN